MVVEEGIKRMKFNTILKAMCVVCVLCVSNSFAGSKFGANSANSANSASSSVRTTQHARISYPTSDKPTGKQKQQMKAESIRKNGKMVSFDPKKHTG